MRNEARSDPVMVAAAGGGTGWWADNLWWLGHGEGRGSPLPSQPGTAQGVLAGREPAHHGPRERVEYERCVLPVPAAASRLLSVKSQTGSEMSVLWDRLRVLGVRRPVIVIPGFLRRGGRAKGYPSGECNGDGRVHACSWHLSPRDLTNFSCSFAATLIGHAG